MKTIMATALAICLSALPPEVLEARKERETAPKYLNTFAAITPATAKPGTPGPNNRAIQIAEVSVTAVMANADTFVVTCPTGFDIAALPSVLGLFTVSGNVFTAVSAALLAITSHDVSTGKTTLTATGAVAAGTKLFMEYYPQMDV